jgi:18S rRNA (guanine1575-N7)-methyltransferase
MSIMSIGVAMAIAANKERVINGPSNFCSMGRPESLCPEGVYYQGDVAEKYNASSSLQTIQGKITQRCLEILGSPEGALILDVGCGSAMSTEAIVDGENVVVGIDISREMIGLGKKRMEELMYGERAGASMCDLMCVDIGDGLPFRSATFDYVVSVSVLQWILVQGESKRRLDRFFYTLYDVLKREGAAVLQYFPENSRQMEEVVRSARKQGFRGGTLVDNPEGKKKKVYLILEMERKIESRASEVGFRVEREQKRGSRTANRDLPRREWILRKKEKRKKTGAEVPHDSKYTGRKRRGKI